MKAHVFENGEWSEHEHDSNKYYACPECTKDYGEGVTVYHSK